MNVIHARRLKSVNKIGALICRACSSNFTFVPNSKPVTDSDLFKLKDFINSHDNICILTGAGISTESGIPDYRSEGVGLYARSNRKPILYKDFCGSDTIRRRYWARNYVGWPRFSSIKPNSTHQVLKKLEDANKVRCIITQNVDNLHTKAGMVAASQIIRPDGDVDLLQEQVEGFKVPPCENCGGILKPDIIFFGDNVPKRIVESVKYNVEHSDSLLVLGSSLTTFSSYRIVVQANHAGKPIAILNIGKTRADELANVKVEGRCGDVLSRIYAMLDQREECTDC
ncbi:NAD-dependent protein deacylase Sirt4 [Anthophora plagiata]